MTDADRQDPKDKIADGNQQHLGGEITGANRQEPLGEKPDADQQHLGGEITDADQQEPAGEKPDADQQHLGGEITDADQQEPASVQSDAEQRDFLAKLDAKWLDPIGAMADAVRHEPIGKKPDADKEEPIGAKPDADQQEPIGAKPDADQQEQVVEFLRAIEPPKPKAGPILLIAAIVVGVGILFGIAIAFITWREAKPTPPPGPIVAKQQSLPRETRDLGSVVSSSVGLQGHLITKWDNKLEYSLVIEPNNPARIAEFALAVSNPPRPLSINVELKNFAGNVLCRQNIVLKYDARKAAAFAAARAQSPAAKSHGRKVISEQDNQPIDFDKLDAQEAERERGKDIFQNQTGPNGQIESIRSQGEIPCPAIAYGSVAHWSFTSNFPDVDEQNELLQRRANAPTPSSQTPATGKGAKANAASPSSKPPATGKGVETSATGKPVYLSIEGDDAIVGYDAATGAIETGAGKTFLMDRTSGEADAIRGRDFPINIHYKCDQTTADCTLSHAGEVLLHAKLKK